MQTQPEITGRAAGADPPPVPPAVFTIAEFCVAHRISRAHFYNLLKLGLGPAVMDVHGRRLVSLEAAAAWRRARETAVAASA